MATFRSFARTAGRGAVPMLTAGLIAAGAGAAWASEEEPPVPADATQLSLIGNQGESLASADVRVSRGLPGQLIVEGWIEDTKKDSRCVYLEYKIVTAFGHDPDDTLVRVCGQGDTDYKVHSTTGLTHNRHEAVEFKLCREEGPKLWPDPDSCSTTKVDF